MASNKLLQLKSKACEASSIRGRTESFWKRVDHVKGLWKNRADLKVEEAGTAALFGLDR
ncbi:hypothetical protein Bca101_079391 [Brassica carinata]|uniref:Uncharacterized protein n=1 Tax=Brassica oleracea var. oleracea TaxID=109376 RepID=A0A0D3DG79_BRAOL